MSKLNNNIPILLREKLGEDFEPEHVLGYRYAAGYWEEDESSWDLPIRDFVREPFLRIYVANDEKEKHIVIREEESRSTAGTEFENLCTWLSQKFQSGSSRKEGVFGVIKEEDIDQKEKYIVEFGWNNGFKRDYDALELIEEISKIMPAGFVFQKYDGWDYFSQGSSYWRWIREEHSSPVTIRVNTCWVYGDNHYHTNCLSIWYEAEDSSAPLLRELNITCRNMAMMIADKYKDKN